MANVISVQSPFGRSFFDLNVTSAQGLITRGSDKTGVLAKDLYLVSLKQMTYFEHSIFTLVNESMMTKGMTCQPHQILEEHTRETPALHLRPVVMHTQKPK